jgi:nitrite reductase/ring-hydroxylating ferredoxin subunit
MSNSIFRPVISAGDIPEGQAVTVSIEGRDVLVSHGESGFFAMDDLCTHNGASLDGGRIKKNSIACPMHGARFDLATGVCLAKALGCPPIVTHHVQINNGQVEVALSDKPVEPPMV